MTSEESTDDGTDTLADQDDIELDEERSEQVTGGTGGGGNGPIGPHH